MRVQSLFIRCLILYVYVLFLVFVFLIFHNFELGSQIVVIFAQTALNILTIIVAPQYISLILDQCFLTYLGDLRFDDKFIRVGLFFSDAVIQSVYFLTQGVYGFSIFGNGFEEEFSLLSKVILVLFDLLN